MWVRTEYAQQFYTMDIRCCKCLFGLECYVWYSRAQRLAGFLHLFRLLICLVRVQLLLLLLLVAMFVFQPMPNDAVNDSLGGHVIVCLRKDILLIN